MPSESWSIRSGAPLASRRPLAAADAAPLPTFRALVALLDPEVTESDRDCGYYFSYYLSAGRKCELFNF